VSRPKSGRVGDGAAIAFEDVVVNRDGRTILDVPRLEIAAGSATVLFGPNGAGKTTMLRLIAGLEAPDTGVVRLDGAPARAGGRIAFGFQEAVFLRGSVRTNLALGLRLRGLPPGACAERVEAAARDCGIHHLLDQDARTLSSGEAQRANLARTLALRAPLTLLDEPLAGFDRVGRARFLDELATLLRALAGTVVLVTHDREEAFRLADRTVVVLAGRVRAAGPLQVVLERPPDAETAELLGYTVVVDDDGATLGIPPGALRLGPGARSFRFVVERVATVGLNERAVGHMVTRAGRMPVELPLPAGIDRVRVGQTVQVAAERWVAIGG
jgi:ABC-type sugar transport system ATPase subunit